MKKWIRTVVLILLPICLLFPGVRTQAGFMIDWWRIDSKTLKEGETFVIIKYTDGTLEDDGTPHIVSGAVDYGMIGDSYTYCADGLPINEAWELDTQNEKNSNLTIDVLSEDYNENQLLVYWKPVELNMVLPPTVYIKDSFTGELIKESYTWVDTVYDEDLEPFSTEDGSSYEFDSENPENHLTKQAGDFVIYFRKVLEVSFDGNGGSIEVEPHTVKQGLSYGELPVPVREGYLFDGWYTQPEGGEEITCDSIVSLGESHTLYARWKKEGEDAEISNGSDSGDLEKATTPEKVTWKKSIAKKGKRIQLRWKKVKGADGYQITIAGSRTFKKAKNRNTTTNKIILKKKKAAQYVKIRAYKKDATGKKVYGAYSKAKKVKAYQ